jgi:hypothetical protein
MRAHVAARLRRLDKLEARALNEDGAVRGGVMLMPRTLSLDEWEAQAMESQRRLVQETQEWIDRENVVPVVEEQRDPEDVTRFYKANPLLEHSHKAHTLR